MLGVVSAVVAFDRWPHGNVSTRLQTLVLAERPAAIQVSDRATGASATPASRAAAPGGAAAPRTGNGPTATIGPRVGGGPVATTPPRSTSPAAPTVPQAVTKPVQDTASPLIDAVSNPGNAASQVADGAQSVTDAAGGSAGQINPDLGNAVTSAGQTAAQAIRDLPLPTHVVPG